MAVASGIHVTSGEDLDLSVVVPMLNEEGNVRELVTRLMAVLSAHRTTTSESFEIIVVDDGSTDDTPNLLRELVDTHAEVRCVQLATNFGQEAAVQAGMLHTRGRWVLQTDGDLQHPPEEIPKLLAKRDEGYEIVYGRRAERKDPWHRVIASRLMVAFMRHGLGIRLPEDVTTFRVIDGEVARLLAGLPEKKKFFSALAGWSGAKSISVPVAHSARHAGHTKYNLGKLINHTFDLMAGFSVRPLRLIGTSGAAIAVVGIAYALFKIGQKLAGVDIETGYTSIFAAVVILGGLQLIALSVIGEYVGRIFIQTQDRPLYRVGRRLGFPDDALPATAKSELFWSSRREGDGPEPAIDRAAGDR
ncbi:MAG: glycosyltransferase family 2 protein [Myxococcota bacterium]